MNKNNAFIEEILNDPSFTAEEQRVIRKFSQAAMRMANNTNVTNFETWNMLTVSSEAGVDLVYPKEGMVMVALWCIFYHYTRVHYPVARLKYQSVGAFLANYRGRFTDYDAHGQEQLKDVANWLNVMFKILPPRKNKGLAIQVIPRLVEGWGVKYVTGSGQTKATADRVYIFEIEGDVQPCHRGGRMAVTAPLRKPQTPSSKKRVIKKTHPSPKSSRPADKKAKKGTHPHSPSHASLSTRVLTRRSSRDTLSTDCLDQLAFSSSFTSALGDTGLFTFPDGVEYPEADTMDDAESPRSIAAAHPHASASASSASASAGGAGAVEHGGLHLAANGALGGALGGAHFQPLFDFGTLGAAGKVGLAPPMLKRAYSWESTSGEREKEASDASENQANKAAFAPVPTQLPTIERTVSSGPLKDFLFDSYLSTTSASTSMTTLRDSGKSTILGME
jgi:hypothetical protein